MLRNTQCLWIMLIVVCIRNGAVAQISQRQELLDIFNGQWNALGDAIEVKVEIRKSMGSVNMQMYGASTQPVLSAPIDSVWYFSNDDFRRSSLILDVKSGSFKVHETAKLRGDAERLKFDSNGTPLQLDVHIEHFQPELGEIPLFQVFFPGMRREVTALLRSATIEPGMIESEPVSIATAAEGKNRWTFFLSNDRVRLRRVACTASNLLAQCDFFYKASAVSWMDLIRIDTATYNHGEMLWAGTYNIKEIKRHQKLSDETFRLEPRTGLIVFDHQELKRRRALGERPGLVDSIAPSAPRTGLTTFGLAMILTLSLIFVVLVYKFRTVVFRF